MIYDLESLLNTEMVQVVEIHLNGSLGPSDPTQYLPWLLLTWVHKHEALLYILTHWGQDKIATV